jgi:HPt (histidine-containing phosphotransfer) domain-containing protein
MNRIINFESVYDLFEQDEESVVAFFASLFELIAETQTNLKNDHHSENWNGIAEALHKLKSSLPYFCEEDLIEQTIALEIAAKEKNNAFVTENLSSYLSILTEMSNEANAFLTDKQA